MFRCTHPSERSSSLARREFTPPPPSIKFKDGDSIRPMRWRYVKSKSRKLYMRSIPRDLLAFVYKLDCGECGSLFTGERYPMVAPCGHFFCIECVNNVEELWTLEEFVIKYFCGRCTNHLVVQELPEKETKKPFATSYYLQSFFEYLYDETQKAYKCTDCKAFHPGNNVIFCKTCSKKAGDTPCYSCVWCARNRHADCTVRIVEENDAPDPRNGANLASIDAHNFKLGAGLVQCAICGVEHQKIVKKGSFKKKLKCDNSPPIRDVVYLPCGHITHLVCATSSKFSAVPCNFHAHLFNMNTHRQYREMRFGKEVKSRIESTFECKKCGETHPSANGAYYNKELVCNWCAIEWHHNMKGKESQPVGRIRYNSD